MLPGLFLQGDCLTVLPRLPPASIDLVICDVPYGQTQNAWDLPIPFAPMWDQLRRVAKKNAAVVLMAAQPFASELVCSNREEFRYDLVWAKNKPTGFLNANRQPLRAHEHLLVFYRAQPVYHPQKTNGHEPVHQATQTSHGSNYGKKTKPIHSGGSTKRHPLSIVPMPIVNNDSPEKWHPTQKPVELMAWLIRSYSDPGAVVLDFAAGSGTTAVAARQEGRRYVCVEREPDFARRAQERLSALTSPPSPLYGFSSMTTNEPRWYEGEKAEFVVGPFQCSHLTVTWNGNCCYNCGAPPEQIERDRKRRQKEFDDARLREIRKRDR